MEYRTVMGAFAYVHPQTGQTYHLVIYQGIEIPQLGNILLPPFQCRVNGVAINNLPKFLVKISHLKHIPFTFLIPTTLQKLLIYPWRWTARHPTCP